MIQKEVGLARLRRKKKGTGAETEKTEEDALQSVGPTARTEVGEAGVATEVDPGEEKISSLAWKVHTCIAQIAQIFVQPSSLPRLFKSKRWGSVVDATCAMLLC